MMEYSKTELCADQYSSSGSSSCGSTYAYIYFISFMIIISMMIMNLFVAVVIEGFAESVRT